LSCAKVADDTNAKVAKVGKIGGRQIGKYSGPVHKTPARLPTIGSTIPAEITEVRCTGKRQAAQRDFALLTVIGMQKEIHTFSGMTG
jgi:hypothetical protein